MNLALGDGNTTRLVPLRESSCKSCTRFEGFIRSTYSKGRRVIGGQLSIDSAVARPLQGNHVTVTTFVTEAPERIVDASGATVESFPASASIDNEVSLVWSDTGWMVTEVAGFGSAR